MQKNAMILKQKLPINGFMWIEDLSEFKEYFIKSFNQKGNRGYFLEVGLQYPDYLHEPHNELPFCPEIKKKSQIQKIF